MALVFGLGCAFAATTAVAVLWITRHRPVPCPRCTAPVEIDVEERGRLAGGAMVEAYRCAACGGEFRQIDRGPLVSLETWNAGADFPRAQVHRDRR